METYHNDRPYVHAGTVQYKESTVKGFRLRESIEMLKELSITDPSRKTAPLKRGQTRLKEGNYLGRERNRESGKEQGNST